MKCLSLFSGIGGFDLACARKNIDLVGACEIDKYARQVYEKRFPGIKIYEDATKINPKELPDFDLLVGGFPCQAFSIAGQRRGFDDARGTLFFEIARIAREKRPRYLLLENVKGLLNHEGGDTIREIFWILNEVGYDAEWQVINSKYYVPQNRERIFIVGHLRGQPVRPIFPIGEYDQVDNGTRPKTQRKGERVQDEISSSLQTTPHKGTSTLVYIAQKNANMKKRVQERNDTWCLPASGTDFGVVDEPKLKPINNAPQGYRVYDKEGIGQCLASEAGGLGAKTGLIVDEKPRPVVNDKKGLREVPRATCLDANYYKGHDYHGARTLIAWSKSTREKGRVESRVKEGEANTLNTGEGCRTQSSANYVITEKSKIRRLTPLECERLQGFPDGWTRVITGQSKNGTKKYMSDTQRYKMCGNAVTVSVIEDILDNIQERL
jgi:DNA (cytosine-5)-methyltransferase 1